MKRFLPTVFIFVVVITFFWRMFYPEPKLIYSVEIIGSDIWNVYYPVKHFLSQSLKAGNLPFWSKDLGIGLPVQAEGQVGTFYLPNLILYWLFPTWLAWNFSLVFTFFLLFLGSYLFFQKLGVSRIGSLFSGFAFSFGGYFVTRIIHMAPLETASLLPWVFLAGEYLWERPDPKRLLLFAFVLSQQIFAGHLQWVIITLIGFVLFLTFHLFEKGGKELPKKLVVVALALTFGFALAAPQILETWQLRQVSARSSGLSEDQVFAFPYGIRNLLTFVFPDYYGTPRDGTYSTDPSLGLFWENTAYMGVLPLLFSAIAILSRKKRGWEWGMIILGNVSLLLALGESSPLYFVHTWPILNNFRVTARFLLLTTFAVGGLAGSGLDRGLEFFSQRIGNQRIVTVVGIVLLLLEIGDVLRFAYPYHSLVGVREALDPPVSARLISSSGRIWTDLTYLDSWKRAYLSHGWKDPTAFVYLKNSLYGNVSYVFDRANVRGLAGLATQRQATIGEISPQTLDLNSVDFAITPTTLAGDPTMEPVATVPAPRTDLPTFSVYRNTDRLSRFRFVADYSVVEGPEKAAALINEGQYPFTESVILESDPGVVFEASASAALEVVADEDQHLALKIKTDNPAILVVADSYYPAWSAWIDGKPTKILPANVNQRAVVVPAGAHTIEMRYMQRMFNRGIWVVVVSLFVFLIVVLVDASRYLKQLKRKEA